MGRSHDYTGGCLVHQRDITSTLRANHGCEGYHEYTGGGTVHKGFHTDPMVLSTTFPTLMITFTIVYIHNYQNG